MKKGIIWALLLMAGLSMPLYASSSKRRQLEQLVAHPPKEIAVIPMLKILLAKDVSDTLVEVKGGYRVFDPRTGTQLSRGLLGKSFFVNALPTGLRWGEEFPGVYQIAIIPSQNSTVYLNGIPYHGTMMVYQIGEQLSFINEVAIEDYLKSVLAKEVDTTLPQEVLAAVAIAARTEAYYQRMVAQESFWQLDADLIGYDGIPNEKTNLKIEEAINTTRYLVLQSADDFDTKGLFPAEWTGHCAGKTAPYHVMHRSDIIGPRQGVEAPNAGHDRQVAAWNFSMSMEDLADVVGLEKVTKVSLYTDSFSEKVYNVRCFNGKETKDMDFYTFQKLLGKNQLHSSEFTVALTKETVSFVGYGEGSGVGLCLYTAEKLAQQGANAAQILTRFYPGTQIVLMPTLPLKSESLAKVSSLIMTQIVN